MKLTIKTLQNQQFSIDISPDEKVSELKKKIEELDQAKQPVDWQKLIHAGKILEDKNTIGSYNIGENDFLVLMVRKPKVSPATSEQPPSQQTSAPPPSTQAPSPTPAPSQSPSTTPAATPSATPSPAEGAKPAEGAETGAPSNSFVTGSEYNAMVDTLTGMGFDKQDVMRALRAAFNNPDRAVEYLTTGIPEVPEMAPPAQSSPQAQQQQQQQPLPTQPSPTQTGGPSPGSTEQPPISPQTPLFPPNLFPGQGQQPQAAPGGGGGGSGVFDFLGQHPQFNMLRQMVQQNPQLLQPVLTQLGQQNPQLLQMISQNQQEFINLLNEPISQGSPGGQGGGMPGGGMPGLGSQYIQVTPEEKAAIDRLEGLGFERSQVIEAFFACDKDETLAANYLLEHQFEEEEES